LAGRYGVMEEVPPGWAVTRIACSSPAESVLTTASVGIELAPGDDVTCVFTNEPAVPTAAIVPDATDPTKTELQVVGTTADDVIEVRGRGAAVDVRINGALLGRFTPTGRIVVNGGAGNDSILVGGMVFPRRAWVDGGDGDDTITTGNGPSVLLGGEGNDNLQSGSARDLLVGGHGADQLFGQSGDDILISGSTSYDANTAALNAILAEWTSTRSYAQRIDNLTGATSGGANGSILLQPGTTVSGDTSADALTGGRATDWFFSSPDDTNDARPFERVTPL
jgi:Ca2+-binding RTX toxin-like protein